MKKLLFVILVFATYSSAFSQFQKGRMLAGGSLFFSNSTSKSKFGNTTTTDVKFNSFGLTPDFGYFVIDNLAVGAGIELYLTGVKFESSGDKSNSSGIGFTPFVRYYLDPGIFFQGAIGFGSNKVKDIDNTGTTTSTVNTSQWSLGAGYAYFLNDKVAIEPFLGYRSNSQKYDNDSKQLQNGLFLNVGFQIYLGGN